MIRLKWKWQDTLVVIFGLLSLGYALINYGKLPDQLPIHFNIKGEIDNYWDKDLYIAVLGSLGILLPLLMHFTRKMDPKKKNYSRFENAYAMSRLAIGLLFNTLFVFTAAYGLGKDINIGRIGVVAIGLLFIVIGNYMPQVKDNYLFGIRTPWTLANPEVWRKTHRLSGAMWIISGLLFILGAFLTGPLSMILSITALLLAIVVPLLYSWIISQGMKT